MPLNFEHYAEKGNEFINKVSYGIPTDRKHAAHITTAVFHTIRDLISVEESLHFIAQLPMMMKAVYVEGWRTTEKQERINSLEEFYGAVRNKCPKLVIEVFTPNKLEHSVRQVIHVLRTYVDQGELNDIATQLHDEVAGLFQPVEL